MSRKITKESVDAFLAGRPFHKGNMSVDIIDREKLVVLKLHGNPIARRDLTTGKLEITNAGWPTVTTRERLNGLPGVSVWQRNHVQIIATKEFPEGIEWNGEWTVVS